MKKYLRVNHKIYESKKIYFEETTKCYYDKNSWFVMTKEDYEKGKAKESDDILDLLELTDLVSWKPRTWGEVDNPQENPFGDPFDREKIDEVAIWREFARKPELYKNDIVEIYAYIDGDYVLQARLGYDWYVVD